MIRRTFLKTSTLALVAVGVGPVGLFSGRAAKGDSLVYSRARFEALVDRRFYVDDGPHPTLELVRVEDGPTAARLEQFTAVFRGPVDRVLDEDQYRVTPEADSAMDLYLIPSGSDAAGNYFVAHFTLQAPLSAASCAAG